MLKELQKHEDDMGEVEYAKRTERMSERSERANFEKYFGERLEDLKRKTQEQVKQSYDEWSSEYDKDVVHQARGTWHRPLAECLDDAIKQIFQDKPKDELQVIDVGAGTGLIGVELYRLGYTSLHALDLSQEMLNEARRKSVYKQFICTPLNDQQIPEIETGEFDSLICGGALFMGHIRPSAFEEMIRMVKKGGLLCFNIRDNRSDNYQGKMLELEKAGRWENVSKTAVPYFDKDDLPRETSAFVYKVLRN